VLFEAGEIEAAHELLTRTLDEATAAGDRATAAWARLFLLEVAASRATGSQVSMADESEGLIGEFEGLGDELGVVSAGIVAGQYRFFLGYSREAEALLTRARERAMAAGLRDQALVASWWELAALFFGPATVQEAEAKIRALEELPGRTRTSEAALLRTKGRFAWIQGRFDEAREMVRTWADIERELGRAVRLASVEGHYLGPLEMAAGRFAEAVEAFRTGFEAQRSLGDLGYSSTVAGGLAHALIEVGDLDEAERYARLALDTSPKDDIEPKMSGGGALAVVLARRGDLEEATKVANEAVALARRTDYVLNQADVLIDQARVLGAAGRRDEALAAIDEAVEILERKEAWALVERAREVAASLSRKEP
jgi:tetratricopeptide (TPR) repeat protein